MFREFFEDILPLLHEFLALSGMRAYILLDGVDEDLGRRADIVHCIVCRAVRDMTEFAEVLELVVRQVRVEAAEDVERVVVTPVREWRQAEPRELAAEDAEVIRDIVADDDAARGKGAELAQDFLRLLAFPLQ